MTEKPMEKAIAWRQASCLARLPPAASSAADSPVMYDT